MRDKYQMVLEAGLLCWLSFILYGYSDHVGYAIGGYIWAFNFVGRFLFQAWEFYKARREDRETDRLIQEWMDESKLWVIKYERTKAEFNKKTAEEGDQCSKV